MYTLGTGIGFLGIFMLTMSIGALAEWSLAKMLIKVILQTALTNAAVFCGFLYGVLSLSISAAVFFYTPIIFNSRANKIDRSIAEDTASEIHYESSSSSVKKPTSAHNPLFSAPPTEKRPPLYETRILGKNF
jgi:hypothetical protein